MITINCKQFVVPYQWSINLNIFLYVVPLGLDVTFILNQLLTQNIQSVVTTVSPFQFQQIHTNTSQSNWDLGFTSYRLVFLHHFFDVTNTYFSVS